MQFVFLEPGGHLAPSVGPLSVSSETCSLLTLACVCLAPSLACSFLERVSVFWVVSIHLVPGDNP